MRIEINNASNLPAIVALREAYPDSLTLDADGTDLSVSGTTVVFTYDERFDKYRMLVGPKVYEIDAEDLDFFLREAMLWTVQELNDLSFLCTKFRAFSRRANDPENTNRGKWRGIALKVGSEFKNKTGLTLYV